MKLKSRINTSKRVFKVLIDKCLLAVLSTKNRLRWKMFSKFFLPRQYFSGMGSTLIINLL